MRYVIAILVFVIALWLMMGGHVHAQVPVVASSSPSQLIAPGCAPCYQPNVYPMPLNTGQCKELGEPVTTIDNDDEQAEQDNGTEEGWTCQYLGPLP